MKQKLTTYLISQKVCNQAQYILEQICILCEKDDGWLGGISKSLLEIDDKVLNNLIKDKHIFFSEGFLVPSLDIQNAYKLPSVGMGEWCILTKKRSKKTFPNWEILFFCLFFCNGKKVWDFWFSIFLIYKSFVSIFKITVLSGWSSIKHNYIFKFYSFIS